MEEHCIWVTGNLEIVGANLIVPVRVTVNPLEMAANQIPQHAGFLASKLLHFYLLKFAHRTMATICLSSCGRSASDKHALLVPWKQTMIYWCDL